MSDTATVLKGLGEKLDKLNEQTEKQAKQIEGLQKKSADNPSVTRVFGIRKGENTLTSRPYSFLKALGLYCGQLQKEEATVECDLSNKLNKHFSDTGWKKSAQNSLVIPFWPSAIGDDNLAYETKSLVNAMPSYDPNEVLSLVQKTGYEKYEQKDLSWVTATAGGTLVPQAAQGELIELLRNKEALIRAGASTFPLPPQGQIQFPAQTAAMTAAWIGEKTTINKSDLTTGAVVLKAKKLGARGSIPNELFRYSNPAADAIVRNDIARVLALALDLAGLEGTGGLQPTGIINTAGVGTYTASTTASDGNTFEAQDWSKLVGTVEDLNAIINENSCAFITRPKLFRGADVRRAAAVQAGDQQGTFVELIKAINPAAQMMKAGFPVITSNQVSGARTKGNGTTLSYVLFGDFSQVLMGMGAVMELDLNPWGDTPWQTDQTEVRGILQADIAFRHIKSFSYCDQLLQS